jgi:hypothetical protein
MTCPQCSAELPDTATFCHTCGSAVRSNPATPSMVLPAGEGSREVPLAGTLPPPTYEQRTAFSYLPAGAPAWPTTMAEMPLYRAGTFAQNDKPGETSARAQALEAKAKRSASSIAVMVLIFLLTPMLAVGATLGTLWINGQFPVSTSHATLAVPTASQQTPATTGSPTTSTPTAGPVGNQLPTPTSFLTAHSAEVGVSLKYPSDWIADAAQVSSTSSAVGFHPTQKNGIYISVERITAQSSAKIGSTTILNQSNLAQFQSASGIVNFKSLPATTPQRSIGGQQWDEMDASFANKNNVIFHLTTISVQHNHIFYDILFYSPQSYYDEAMQKYFQPMFDSFQFQS